jgi:hypothetical protein
MPSKMPHTGAITIGVAVRPIGTDGIVPEHTGQVGNIQTSGPGQVSPGQVNSSQIDPDQVCVSQVSIAQIGPNWGVFKNCVIRGNFYTPNLFSCVIFSCSEPVSAKFKG